MHIHGYSSPSTRALKVNLGKAALALLAIHVVGSIDPVWVMFSNFTALLLARAMDPARQRARLIKETTRMRGHYIVCGLGRIGANVAKELHATGQRDVAIEPLQAAVDEFVLQGDSGNERVLFADATEDNVLLDAGLRGAGRGPRARRAQRREMPARGAPTRRCRPISPARCASPRRRANATSSASSAPRPEYGRMNPRCKSRSHR